MPREVQRHKRILIYLTPAFIAEFLRYNPNLLGCFRTTQLILPPQKRESVERILYSLLRECRDASAADMVMVKSLLGELLTLLNRYVAAEPMPLEIPKRDAASEKILEVVKYINSNFAEPLSLTMLSERFFIVPTHLSRLFRRVTGFTYAEYVNRVRIRHGAKLLLETKKRLRKSRSLQASIPATIFVKFLNPLWGARRCNTGSLSKAPVLQKAAVQTNAPAAREQGGKPAEERRCVRLQKVRHPVRPSASGNRRRYGFGCIAGQTGPFQFFCAVSP